MDKFDNGVLSSVAVGWSLPHHPEKRYTPIAVGVPVCSGKMNSIVKNYKDYCMDIICRNPRGCGNSGGSVCERGLLSGRCRLRKVAHNGKVIVWFL